MKRREFLLALTGATLAVGFEARGQKPDLPVIGILYGASSAEWPNRFAALRNGLAETGYSEGRNVAFDIRLLDGAQDRAAEAAAELVRRRVAMIVATGGPQIALAAKGATATIPIVVTFGGDPVGAGLVASLNRPGGNLTGITILTVELTAKLLDVFHEIVPSATSVAVLVNPESPVSAAYMRATTEAARNIGLDARVLKASTVGELDAAFASLSALRMAGLVVAADPFFEIQREQLIALAGRYRAPTFYFAREFVALGGLASYGTSFNEVVRTVGVYAGRILKGAKPSELPVLEPTKFELVINARTAKTLDLAIPQSLLLRADEVIH